MAPGVCAVADDRVMLGAIAGAHGVRGDVRLKSFAGEPEAIAAYGPLEDEDGSRRFEIVSLRPGKGALIARIKGITDRAMAEALKGTALYVAKDRLPPPEPGTWYHDDLVGLAAVLQDGSALGAVIAIHNFGAGDLIEIRLEGSRKTVLVPFTEANVPDVDVEGGRIVMTPPDGLIENTE